MVDRIQSVQADLACTLSKKGNSLLKIAQALKVEPDAVLDLIAMKTQLEKHEVEIIFNSMEQGLSFNEMPSSIPVEALQIFVPGTPQTVLTSNYSYRAEIRERSKDFTVAQIATNLGMTTREVEDVLASEDSESVAPSQAPTEAVEAQIRKPSFGGEESKTPALRQPKAEERIEPPSLSPVYIYSYKHLSSSLFRTTLSTGEIRKERVRDHTFKRGSAWCEVAGGDIYFTGGLDGSMILNEVIRVSGNSLEVTQKVGMLSARVEHGSVYDKDYLYAIGGWNRSMMNDCERLSVSKDRWEALQPLPQACCNVSVVVVKETECLYALGGGMGKFIAFDVIQRLSLGKLEWDVMPLRLPSAANGIACFSKESKVW
eukprot:CAMPEP_0204902226 /NCGR_PEP_ID=MMETSP1397-20131031/3538_1 /ASSEMBLY_ACC=CAM_ASM_000891 /TAXON_ID=49980 /ORGANISM="Climacostomum Climacostomum virens, Strain Stock W-24" /LENGTH=371 /DNA_ID=CAMNT_0052070689 /DNA_START=867 /DNA_END=1979 /DNA_ORIENTATION=+